MAKTKAYWKAIEFIALNDEPSCRIADEVYGMLTVVCTSAAFDISQQVVTEDVLRLRRDEFGD